MNLSEEFNNVVNKAFVVVDSNKVLYTVIGLFLALYAALAAPVLPPSITKFFKNTWFKLGFMFLIGYMATKNASVAIISAVALLVTLQTLADHETTNTVIARVEAKIESNIEKFQNNIADVDYNLLSNNYQTQNNNNYPVDNIDDYLVNEDNNVEEFEDNNVEEFEDNNVEEFEDNNVEEFKDNDVEEFKDNNYDETGLNKLTRALTKAQKENFTNNKENNEENFSCNDASLVVSAYDDNEFATF